MNKRFTLRSVNGVITLKDYGVNWQCNLDDEEPEVIKEINGNDMDPVTFAAVRTFYGNAAVNLNKLDENPFVNEDDIRAAIDRFASYGIKEATDWYSGIASMQSKCLSGRFHFNDTELCDVFYEIHDRQYFDSLLCRMKRTPENYEKCCEYCNELNRLDRFGNTDPLTKKMQEVREEGI